MRSDCLTSDGKPEVQTFERGPIVLLARRVPTHVISLIGTYPEVQIECP